MLRMAHRIAVEGWSDRFSTVKDREFNKVRFGSFKHACARAECFVVDNVAKFYAESPRDDWKWCHDFPGCFPFHDTLLIEFANPSHAMADGKLEKCDPGFRAVLIQTYSVEKFHTIPLIDDMAAYVSCCQFAIFEENDFWFLNPFALVQFDAERQLIKPPEIPDSSNWEESVADDLLCGMLHIPLLSLSFANCRNVIRKDAGAEYEPERPWARKHAAPKIRYRILNIEPMMEVLKGAGKSDEVGPQKAIHICRGHFAHYTEERPLFGKYSGSFWVPSHVRGKSDRGMVLKDYSITGN